MCQGPWDKNFDVVGWPAPCRARRQKKPSTVTARPTTSRFKCLAIQTGFFTRLGRLIKEKAKNDVEKIFSGFSKTKDNLAVIDELLLYWNLADIDRVLDELEEVFFLHSLFKCYPKSAIKVLQLDWWQHKKSEYSNENGSPGVISRTIIAEMEMTKW